VREPERRPDGECLLRELNPDRAGLVGRAPGSTLVRLEALAEVLTAYIARHLPSLGPGP
jgi:hypothetical protein